MHHVSGLNIDADDPFTLSPTTSPTPPLKTPHTATPTSITPVNTFSSFDVNEPYSSLTLTLTQRHPYPTLPYQYGFSTISRDTILDDVSCEDHNDRSQAHTKMSSVTFDSATKKWNDKPTRRFLTVEKGFSVN